MARTEIPASRFPELLANVALASGVGYVAAAYGISRWLTRPTPSRPQQSPADFGLPCEPLRCRTPDGMHLSGWLIEPPQPRATVALFHGMRGSREKLLSRMALLAGHGYRCLAFDHRAHGESSGKRTSFGYHERQDVIAILELLRARWPNQPRAALGISMGAAALCYAARAAKDWQAVILESCYQDISQAFNSRLHQDFPPWYQRLSRGVIWVTERRLGVRLDQLAPVEHIGDLAPTPVFILTGAEDPHASPAEASQLYERCRGPRELWLVPGAAHRDVFDVGGSAYQERILDFLDRGLAA